MAESTADVSVFIEAPPREVWDALTDPTKISEYYLGATVTSDWELGSPITWSGEWKGQTYEDKGEVLAVEPERRLSYSHWSPLSGTADKPDNYHVVDVYLTRADGGTAVRLTQSNLSGEVSEEDLKARDDYEKNWRTLLEGLKRVVEGDVTPLT